ncbi:MAG: tetratricopeptide repeat protein, partial [Myxococcota bacterium]
RDAREKADLVWNAPRREAMSAAFTATEVPYAADALTLVTRRVDEYVDAWVTMHNQACEATRVRHEQSVELMDMRLNCLHRRMDELATLVDIWADADKAAVKEAPRSAAALQPLDECADARALLSLPAMPSDEYIASEIDEVRSALARVRALMLGGRERDSLVAATRAYGLAARIDFPPTTAESLLELGSLQSRMGRLEAAENNLRDAYWTALAARHDRVAIDAVLSMMHLLSFRLHRPADALTWSRHAAALLDRSGERFSLTRAQLLFNIGVARHVDGHYDEAHARYLEALAMREQLTAGPTQASARILNNLGVLHKVQGDFQQAIEKHEQVLRINRELLGEQHPVLAGSLHNLGSTLLAIDRFSEALPYLQRALAIEEAVSGRDQLKLVRSLNNIGYTHLGLGQLD